MSVIIFMIFIYYWKPDGSIHRVCDSFVLWRKNSSNILKPKLRVSGRPMDVTPSVRLTHLFLRSSAFV